MTLLGDFLDFDFVRDFDFALRGEGVFERERVFGLRDFDFDFRVFGFERAFDFRFGERERDFGFDLRARILYERAVLRILGLL